MSLLNLPVELVGDILALLDVKDLLSAALVRP